MAYLNNKRPINVFQAASNGDLSELQGLIQNGADVSDLDEKGLTALHYASFYGHLDIVAVLLSSGCDVNATTTSEHYYDDRWEQNTATSVTALHLAAYNGHLATVKALVEAGADPFATCEYKYFTNAVEMAGWCMHKDVVDFLVDLGALTSGLTPAQRQLRKAIMDGDTEELKLLMAVEGFDINQRCFCIYDERLGFEPNPKESTFCSPVLNKGTALHLAIQSGNSAVLDMILDHPGVLVDVGLEEDTVHRQQQDKDYRNRNDVPPLHFAVRLGDTAAVEKLLKAGADIERNAICWSLGRYYDRPSAFTPLGLAFASKHLDMARLLLAAGADPHGRLLNDGADPHTVLVPMHYAAACNSEAINLLLKHGASVNPEGYHGVTPLYWAVFYGPIECVATLLKAGADADWYIKDFDDTFLDSIVMSIARWPEQLDESDKNYRLIQDYVPKFTLLVEAGMSIYSRYHSNHFYPTNYMGSICDVLTICPQGYVLLEKMIESSAALGRSFFKDYRHSIKHSEIGNVCAAVILPEKLSLDLFRCAMVVLKAGHRPETQNAALVAVFNLFQAEKFEEGLSTLFPCLEEATQEFLRASLVSLHRIALPREVKFRIVAKTLFD